MTFDDEMLSGLREALQDSPNNVRLRQHLADMLLKQGHSSEAEQEYKAALVLKTDSLPIKLGLAQTFYTQGKNSAALVLVEELLQYAHQHPAIALLYSRLLQYSGDVEKARHYYQQAVGSDSQLADPQLETALQPTPEPEPRELTDPFKVRVSADIADDTDIEKRFQNLEKPSVSFQHVGGMEQLKEEIRLKIIHPLSHPELYKAYGKSIGGGILLYGPPGCGKTYLARATAGEVRAGFLAVGIHDILDMWLGQSERNLHDLFEQARMSKPSVLFFDEVDALGANRSDMRRSAGRQLINQFLAELDGAQYSNEGVLILAATNAPWHLDSAFRRPGRFDRIIFVPPPDALSRASILQILLSDKPHEDIYYDEIAKKTDGFSGADLKALIDRAIEDKLTEALKRGAPMPLTQKDLVHAARQLKPTTREWFNTARNYALYSNQGGFYDDILSYLDI